jgi:dCTP deaminase
MTILTDREILHALDSGHIVINPRPDADKALSSTSVDLTLARRFAEWPKVGGMEIRPGHPDYRYVDYAETQRRIDADHYTLKPGDFVLGWTAEKLHIPVNSQLAARVEGKSNLARLGLCVHITAPTIHSGFGEDHIQLEMVNFGPNTLVLDAGMRICQLIFERTVGTPEKGYEGMFSKTAGHGQIGSPSAGKGKAPKPKKGQRRT